MTITNCWIWGRLDDETRAGDSSKGDWWSTARTHFGPSAKYPIF